MDIQADRKRRQRKETIGALFHEIPFIGPSLYIFVNLLLFDRRSRWAIFGFIFLVGSGLLALPKLWRVTPEDAPDIRISALDFLQAQALARTARRAENEGDIALARRAWHISIANHMGHKEHLRTFIRNEISRFDERSTPMDSHTYTYARQLMQLSHTNNTDLNLALKVADRSGSWEGMQRMIGGLAPTKRSPETQSANLRALFWNSTLLEEFKQSWAATDAAVTEAEDLELYRLAFEATSDEATQREKAMTILQQKALDARADSLPLRIWLKVEASNGNLENFETALHEIERRGLSNLEIETQRWRLLSQNGRLEKARSLALNSGTPPKSLRELQMKLGALASLDLEHEIIPFLESQAVAFIAHPGFSPIYCGALASNGAWDRLLQFTNEVSAHPVYSVPWVQRYLSFVAGLSHSQLEQPLRAKLAFETYKDTERIPLPREIDAQIAKNILDYQPTEFPLQSVIALEPFLEKKSAYWKFRAYLAEKEQDIEEAKRSTRIALRLDPTDALFALSYTGLCILSRSTDEELQSALQITSRFAQRFPDSPWPLLNHAYALFLNGHPAQARGLLERLNPTELDADQRATANLLRLELHVAEQDWNAAKKVTTRLRRTDLSELQLPWYDQAIASIP